MAVALAAAILAVGLSSCGGNPNSGNPPPPPLTISVSCSASTVVAGGTTTCTAITTGGTVTWGSNVGSFSPATGTSTTYTSPTDSALVSNPEQANISALTTDGARSATSNTVAVSVEKTLTVNVVAAQPTVPGNGTVQMTATVAGGNNPTVTWTGPGSFSPTTGTSTTWTPPAGVLSSPDQTVTATAKDSLQSDSQDVTETVVPVIAVDSSMPVPNRIFYSPVGTTRNVIFDCSGCVNGDTLTANSTPAPAGTVYGQIPLQGDRFGVTLNFTGGLDIPSIWTLTVLRDGNPVSNELQFEFVGGANEAVQNRSTGEIYYGDPGSGTVWKYGPDGTPDGSIQYAAGIAMAVDVTTEDLVVTEDGGVVVYSADGSLELESFSLPNNWAAVTAASAGGGLACVAQPDVGAVSCFVAPTQDIIHPTVIQLSEIPPGSQPRAVRVSPDGSTVAVYCTANQTLYTFHVDVSSGTEAKTSSQLLTQFAATDAAYWQSYPTTGGWGIFQPDPGSGTWDVRGVTVNQDGTVGQELAVVGAGSAPTYYNLPAGTIHLSVNYAAGTLVAVYTDWSGANPVDRFETIDPATGKTTALISSSSFVPAGGFVATNGGELASFLGGQLDLQPNQ